MKKLSLAFVLTLSAFLILVLARAADRNRTIHLPSSKNLTLPVPGYLARTNSSPANIAVSPDKRYAALLNQGYGTQESGTRQSIAILDLSNNHIQDFPDNRLGQEARQSYFIGLAFSADGKHLYASVGSITDPTGEKPNSTGNGIAVYKFSEGEVTPEHFIKIPPQRLAAGKEVPFALRKTPAGTAIPYPAGFALIPHKQGDRLLIADNLSDNVILLDVNSGQILKSFDISRSRYVPAAYPYTVIANRAGTKAWVSLWNDSSIAELDLESGTVAGRMELFRTSPTSASYHLTAMALSSNENVLYTTLSNTSDVFAFDVKSRKVLRTYGTRHLGAVPQALTLLKDDRLFVASGGLNAVAIFELKTAGRLNLIAPKPLGFIPTPWYPTGLAIIGNDLLIATAKGEGSGPNNTEAKVQGPYHRKQPYIATLIGGSIQRISLADIDENLAAYTKQVEQDNLIQADPGKFQFAAGKNPIRHVIYVLKENRTYDQIFGDLPVGDGDPSLTMYGAEITPNEHKLALQFGVLDNFYDSGEVSGDGHIWSTASTTSDYNEKNWPIAYRGHERTYDADGTNAEELPLDKGIPDIDDPGTGFIWDNLAKRGLSYRIYGEFIHGVWCKPEKVKSPKQRTPSSATPPCAKPVIRKGEALPTNVGNPPGSPSPWPWPVPVLKQMRPTKAALRDHFDPLFPDFNIDYPDQLRADEFLREFNEFVKAKGTPKELPQFILLYLPDDHTGGTRPSSATPAASVADNDLAVGRVVEAVSHSAYWDDTAIFVVEDDAQNGVDHVDAHRSIALVISKYSPKNEKPFVEHNFYTTVNMIHTMEELLRLPPMNLFDAHAPLMAPLLSGPGTQPPYTSDDKNLRGGLLYQVNEKKAEGAKESLQMDFSRPDAANAKQLNAILWRNAKGNAPVPSH